MKYKIGDRVKVRQDLEYEQLYGGYSYIGEMKKKYITIALVITAGIYLVEENDYIYTNEMLDGLDNFKQEDIKSGMLVETRRGTKKLVVDTTRGLILKSEDGYMPLSDYKDFKMKNKNINYDIVKVGETTGYGTNISNMRYKNILWQEPIKIELTDKERKILEALDTLGYTHFFEDEDNHIVVYLNGEFVARLPHLRRDDFSFMNEDSGVFNIKELLEC